MAREVYVILLAVELLEFGFEVPADLTHALFTVRQQGAGHGLAPVVGDEHQGDMKVADDVTSRTYVRPDSDSVWVA